MKNILFTGSSGFLGLSILPILMEKYFVDTLSFHNISTYTVDLSKEKPVFNKRYDMVIHAAGKAHSIPQSKYEEQLFYGMNYEGTKNLCAGLESFFPPRNFIFISTVAVYGCESGECIAEDHSLNANTSYGKSKIQAEKYLLEWCERHGVLLTILRPSLLAGKNPPGNLGAMINGIASGKYLSINGGMARKSVAMATDIGRLIPYCDGNSGIFNFCDDHNPSFRELEELVSKQLNKRLPPNVPMWSARCMAKIGDILNVSIINTQKLAKITQSLTFSNEKIKKALNFTPADVLSNFSIY